MPRKCFRNWSDDDLDRLVGKRNTDEISVEDMQEASKKSAEAHLDVLKQAAAIRKGVDVIARAKNPLSGLHGMLTRDPMEETQFLSADQRINAIRSANKAKISDFMADLAPTTRQVFAGIATGERSLTKGQQRLLDDFVHELYGRQTGNSEAQKAAKSWNKINNDLIGRFKKAGGDVSDLEDWRLPQKHDRPTIRKAGADSWVEKIWDKLDTEKMLKSMPKGSDEDSLREALYKTYHNIITDGLSSNKVKNRKLRNSMNNQRFIKFKDSDSWLKYQREFGDNNVYASLLGYIDGTSRAIGMMETFGPDPDIGYSALERAAKIRNGNDQKKYVPSRQTFEMLMGYAAVEERTVAANTMAGMRNLWTASKLGSAVISALTDSVYVAAAARYNGMPANKVLRGMFDELFKKGISEDSRKRWAQDFGYGADFALDRMAMTDQYSQTFGGHRTRNVAESVMIASGMNRWTESARATFQFEFNAALTRALDKSWNELPRKMSLAMGRYGITEADWVAMSKAPMTEYKGQKMMNPMNLPDELQAKFIGMIDGETMMAVPTPDARTRARMSMGTKSGTTGGEVAATMTMFHSFAVTTIMNQWRRVFFGKAYNGQIDRFMSGAVQVGALTAIGMGATQINEILSGREPLGWDDPTLWIRGFARGGAFNYIGDMINNASSGFSHSTTSYIGGPLVAYGDWVAATTSDVARGDFEKARSRSVNFALEQIPFQNLWYTKLMTDRLLMDRIKRLSDPNYDKKQIQRMREMKKESNQEYWYSPPIHGKSQIKPILEE